MPRAVPAPNIGRMFSPPPPDSRVRRRLLNLLSGSNVWLYRVSGGRIGGRMGRAPVLLLHHVGRRSGRKRVTPLTTIEVGRRRIRVRARDASEEERGAYWPRLVEIYPSYDLYRRRTSRVLPVIVLEPVEGEEAPHP